jgi:hypothetical protein
VPSENPWFIDEFPLKPSIYKGFPIATFIRWYIRILLPICPDSNSRSLLQRCWIWETVLPSCASSTFPWRTKAGPMGNREVEPARV